MPDFLMSGYDKIAICPTRASANKYLWAKQALRSYVLLGGELLINALSSVLEKLTNFRRFSQREIKVLPQSDGRELSSSSRPPVIVGDPAN